MGYREGSGHGLISTAAGGCWIWELGFWELGLCSICTDGGLVQIDHWFARKLLAEFWFWGGGGWRQDVGRLRVRARENFSWGAGGLD